MNSFVKIVVRVMPIHKGEILKFALTATMMMVVVYMYSVLRNAKDALVIPFLGAELISTLKLYGVLPSSILFMLVYTKLVDVFKKVSLYHGINLFFASFFAVFALFLYPNSDNLLIDLSGYIVKFPYLKYLFVMISHWHYSLFYILSELVGSVMLSLLFWQLANQITTLEESKRFYPLFGLIGQIGLILAGEVMIFATRGTIDWQASLNHITFSLCIASAIFSGCFWYISNKIVDKDIINGVVKISGKPTKKKGPKMTFFGSLAYVASSKYIGLIALLVLCYGISINLVEGVWKSILSGAYPTSTSYAEFNGYLQRYTGIATAIAMISGSYLLRVLSWRVAAILTPIMILITGALFFMFIVFKSELSLVIAATGIAAVTIAVFAGAAQNILSKSIKYAFFDPTKEMAYIPLDEDLKAKGKAAADVIGGRLGKSGGAMIQFAMLSIIQGATLVSIAPSMFVIFVVVMCVWLFAVSTLSKEFAAKVAEDNKQ